MEDNSVKIDPERFAMTFMSTLHADDSDKDIERLAKHELAAYLTAYFLIEKFNKLDAQNFNAESDQDWHQLPFGELLSKVSELNRY
ncbi:hypothetical protein ACRYI5_10140 [Furfurilactobacillus sp. WILCCON 0119]